MRRRIYDADHESFRDSVREFLDRQVRPRGEEFIEARAFPRDFWLEAGKQGFLGLEIPEEYGGAGAGDFRFNAVLAEELAKVTAALSSCFGIHADIVAPYLVDLGTEEQKQRWLPGFCTGELLTAIGMTEPVRRVRPRRAEDHRGPRRRRVGHQRVEDLHHQRLLRRPGHHGRAHRARRRARRASPCSASRPAMAGFSRGRKLDKVGQSESDTSELFFENVRVPRRRRHRRGRPGLHPHDGAAAAGAARLRGLQHRARQADPGRDDPVRQGPPGVRPADRRLPAQQVPARRAGHPDRGLRGATSTSACSRTPRAS